MKNVINKRRNGVRHGPSYPPIPAARPPNTKNPANAPTMTYFHVESYFFNIV